MPDDGNHGSALRGFGRSSLEVAITFIFEQQNGERKGRRAPGPIHSTTRAASQPIPARLRASRQSNSPTSNSRQARGRYS